MRHHELVAPFNAHSVGFRQTTDPSLDIANDVQANAVWVEVDAGDAVVAIWIRNAANTGWDQFIVDLSAYRTSAAQDVIDAAQDATLAADYRTAAAQDTIDTASRDRANHTGTQLAATISDLTETVQDIVGAMMVAGSNVTIVYDDVANTITITATGGGGTAGRVLHQAVIVALGGAADVTISAIPATHEGVLIEGVARSTAAADTANASLQIEGDTGANYSYSNENRFGATSTDGSAIGWRTVPAASQAASSFGQFRIEFYNYLDTNMWRTVNAQSWCHFGAGGGLVVRGGGVRRNTAVLTTCRLFPDAGNWAEFSVFRAYLLV